MKIPLPRPRRRNRIEIIPLIDIMFFLLATFMMVSLSMAKYNAIPVQLPSAATGRPQEPEDHASLSLTRDGELFFNRQPIRLEQLPDRLRRFQAETRDPKIVIHGDARSFFGQAIEVLDAVRQAGIARVAIQTQPAAKDEP